MVLMRAQSPITVEGTGVGLLSVAETRDFFTEIEFQSGRLTSEIENSLMKGISMKFCWSLEPKR